MRHSGNTGKVVGAEYRPEQGALKIYVYDEVERFITVASVKFTRKDLAFWLGGLDLAKTREGEEAQEPLPWS